MNWHSWSEFVHMGGYGLYVWGAFAITGMTLSAEVLQLVARRRQALQQLRAEQEGEHETS
jgi:heme exporter protein D